MSVSSFLADYKSQTRENPIGPPEERYWSVNGGLVLTVLYEFEGRVHFSSIRSPSRGEGRASEVLKKITALADKHQVEIDLTPEPFGSNGLSKSNLKKWYARHGWVSRKGYSGEMIRKPKSSDRLVLKPDSGFKGAFESAVECLSERKTDTVIREAADSAFRKIRSWFESIGPEKFWQFFGNPIPSYFGIDLKHWGKASIWPGQLHFTTIRFPKAPRGSTAGLGRDKSGNAVIRFYDNVEEERFQQIFPKVFHTRWSGYYLSFVHEYTHWFDQQRRRSDFDFNPASTIAVSAGDMSGYINTPEELQAHYIELTAKLFNNANLFKKVRQADPATAERVRLSLFGGTFSEFLEKVRNSADWWKFLTPDNEKRMIKRLSGTWDELQTEWNNVRTI